MDLDSFNISLYPGSGTMDGRKGDHVLLAPAYNVTEEDIRAIVHTTTAVVKQFFRRYADRPSLPNGERPVVYGSTKSKGDAKEN